MYLQLYEQLRAAIVNDCRIPRSAKLPSTHALSETLSVSRNTVIGAFEQLLAVGYLEGRIGSGTYVAHALPEACLGARPQASAPGYGRPPARVSERGLRMRELMPSTKIADVVPGPTKPKPFRLHAPSFESFPYDVWRKLSHRTWDLIRPEMLGYGCPAGWQPLREAVAHYLRAARAVRCDWQQLIITNGAKQAMHLVAQTMTDPGDPVFIENPNYSGIRIGFTLSGAKMLPVPVDREDLEIATAEQLCPDARLVYVTPSHQYPLGTTMSLNRRLALLGLGAAVRWVCHRRRLRQRASLSRPAPGFVAGIRPGEPRSLHRHVQQGIDAFAAAGLYGCAAGSGGHVHCGSRAP